MMRDLPAEGIIGCGTAMGRSQWSQKFYGWRCQPKRNWQFMGCSRSMWWFADAMVNICCHWRMGKSTWESLVNHQFSGFPRSISPPGGDGHEASNPVFQKTISCKVFIMWSCPHKKYHTRPFTSRWSLCVDIRRSSSCLINIQKGTSENIRPSTYFCLLMSCPIPERST